MPLAYGSRAASEYVVDQVCTIVRLFVAIEIDQAARKVVREIQQALVPKCAGVKWTPPELVHLTVKFLGDVPDGDVAGVGEAVSRATKASAPFELGVESVGCFPPSGSVRIVWIGAGDSSGRLKSLVERVEAEMEELSFPRENRPFAAHLTIGRAKEDRSGGAVRAAVAAAKLKPFVQSVTSVTLMSSVLSPKGPTYTPVHRATLGI